MTARAEIRAHDGWWFRYTVHRTSGVFIPENSVSSHRTLSGARRAAQRWVCRPRAGEPIESHRQNHQEPPNMKLEPEQVSSVVAKLDVQTISENLEAELDRELTDVEYRALDVAVRGALDSAIVEWATTFPGKATRP